MTAAVQDRAAVAAVAYIRDELGDEVTAKLVASTAAVRAQLNGSPLTSREIAQRSGVSKSAAHRTLVRLTAAGIATHEARGWVLADADSEPTAQAGAVAASRCTCGGLVYVDEDGDPRCAKCGKAPR